MPAYALLGATGSTGSAILRCLLAKPPADLTLNIFVRSKDKLLKTFPDLESTSEFSVNIFEGTPDNTTLMQDCLKNVNVVFACIATNESTPGVSLVYDTATTIVSALKAHQTSQGAAYKTPTIIQLRSCSVNTTLAAHQPWLANRMAHFAFYYVYADLDKACELFESSSSKSPGLLDYIFMDPPSIHDANGTTPTGYRLVLTGEMGSEISYADLGAAFCEVAQRRKEFAGEGVGVSPTGKVNQTWGTLMGFMFTGVKSRIWG